MSNYNEVPESNATGSAGSNGCLGPGGHCLPLRSNIKVKVGRLERLKGKHQDQPNDEER